MRGQPRARQIEVLQAQIESLPVAVLVADNTARYVAANARACELTGFSLAELRAKSVADLVPVSAPPDRFANLWQAFISLGVQKGDFELARKDGTVVSVRYHAWASVAPGLHISLLTPA